MLQGEGIPFHYECSLVHALYFCINYRLLDFSFRANNNKGVEILGRITKPISHSAK